MEKRSTLLTIVLLKASHVIIMGCMQVQTKIKSDYEPYICVVYSMNSDFYFFIAIHPYKAEQPLQGMELHEKEAQKDPSIQEIPLERIYS